MSDALRMIDEGSPIVRDNAANSPATFRYKRRASLLQARRHSYGTVDRIMWTRHAGYWTHREHGLSHETAHMAVYDRAPMIVTGACP